MVDVKDEKLNVSVGYTVAYGMWAITAGLVVAAMVTGDLGVFSVAVLSVGIAATATVRTYFVEFSTMVRQAFDLDEESVTTLPRRR